MLVSPFLSSFLKTYYLSMSFFGSRVLGIVINFLVLWLICEFLPCPFQECSRVSFKGYFPCIYSLDETSVADFDFGKFSCFLGACLMVSGFSVFLILS